MRHTTRTLKAHERKAKLIEARGVCQAAGFHPPPGTPLFPHHPEAYARRKTTSFYDTVVLAPFEYRKTSVTCIDRCVTWAVFTG